MTNTDENKVRDYLAEKEEQRLGTVERADAKDAARDALFDLETRLVQVKVFADSIMRRADSYVEEIGKDAPDDLQHIQFCLWHLADDISRFEEDFGKARIEVSHLIA